MTNGWLRRHRTAIALLAGIPVLLLVGLGATGYAMLRHFNANIAQVNVTALLGRQVADTHPGAENVLFIGSHTGSHQPGTGLNAYQSGTLILLHIPADRKWAEVISIPPESYVPIPSCTMSNGQVSAPAESMINRAFATGNLFGHKTADGAACTVKTVEQDTGLYINHFVVVDFTGFRNMVAALGGVPVDLATAFDDPSYGVDLPAGRDVLTPDQALGYVRALSDADSQNGDLTRLVRQRAFVSGLIGQARSKLYNPVTVYRFLDAVTKSLTIDSQLGGITGLYHLTETVRGIPSGQISLFTLPSRDSSNVVLWQQPEDSQIFVALRNDTRLSPALLAAIGAIAV